MSSNQPRIIVPPDRVAECLVVGGNLEKHGGVVVKIALKGSNRTETLTLFRAASQNLVTILNAAMEHGLIPDTLSKPERANLVAFGMKIEDYDWHLQNERGRIVGGIAAADAPDGIAFDFTMKNGASRLFLIPGKIARYLGEYLYQYRDCIDPDESSPPSGQGG